MKRALLWTMVWAGLYAATGVYIVRGNEQALLRRCGKADRVLRSGGLHFDLPWPFAQVQRVKSRELRTISVGLVAAEPFDGAGFLRDAGLDRQAEFLTGDKNILNLQVNVHYVIIDPLQFYAGSQAPEIGLKLLAESLVTDAVAQCSVDYVHPLGLQELRAGLMAEVRQAAARQPWGLAVEDVTISGVLPPVEVKAAFLDVSNARAERDRMISQELSRAEKLRAATEAGVRQLLDRAETERLTRVEAARGTADRFVRIIEQFPRPTGEADTTASGIRRSVMQRLWIATLEELLPRLARQVILDPRQPVDLFLVEPATAAPRASGSAAPPSR